MQRIYLLSTGGTIEKVYSEQSGAVENRAAKLDRAEDFLLAQVADAAFHDSRCRAGKDRGAGNKRGAWKKRVNPRISARQDP